MKIKCKTPCTFRDDETHDGCSLSKSQRITLCPNLKDPLWEIEVRSKSAEEQVEQVTDRPEACPMCDSAWTNPELTGDNDLSYHTLSGTKNGYRLMLRAGARKPVTILMEKYTEGIGWKTVEYYRPLYCPNCGRKLEKSAPKEF